MPHLRFWLTTLAALAPTVLLAAPLPVQITKFEGEVVQVAGSAHSGIALGKSLEAGTEIRTGKDGRAELSLHGDPTLALGNGVQLLVHSLDQRVLRLRIASGAVRVDTRAAKGGKSRDVRLNVGDLRVRVANADAWTELGERGGQVCLIAGVVEAQQPSGVARLDTPGQCLRQSGLTSQWSMVPMGVLQERIALLGVREVEVALPAPAAPAPAPVAVTPEIKIVPLPVPPAVETTPAPAEQAGVRTPAAVELVEIPPPPAPPKLETAPAAAAMTQVALAAPAEVVEVPPPPAPAVLDPAPAAAAVAALTLPAVVEVLDVPPEPTAKPAVVVEAPVAEAPVVQTPVVQTPVVETAGVETSVVETSVVETAPEAASAPATPAAAAMPVSTGESTSEATDLAPATSTVALTAAAVEVMAVPEPPLSTQPEVTAEPKPTAEAVSPPAAANPEPAVSSAPAASPAATTAATTEVATAANAGEPAVDDGRRWRVVLGSMPERAAAEQESERLNARGWAVEPRAYRVGERQGYRIGFGEFATRDDAQKALDEFVAQFPDAPAWLAKY